MIFRPDGEGNQGPGGKKLKAAPLYTPSAASGLVKQLTCFCPVEKFFHVGPIKYLWLYPKSSWELRYYFSHSPFHLLGWQPPSSSHRPISNGSFEDEKVSGWKTTKTSGGKKTNRRRGKDVPGSSRRGGVELGLGRGYQTGRWETTDGKMAKWRSISCTSLCSLKINVTHGTIEKSAFLLQRNLLVINVNRFSNIIQCIQFYDLS